MEFDANFSSEDVVSWLKKNEFSSAVVDKIEQDDADGKDLLALTRHENLLRGYFPSLKDRLKLLDKVREEQEAMSLDLEYGSGENELKNNSTQLSSRSSCALSKSPSCSGSWNTASRFSCEEDEQSEGEETSSAPTHSTPPPKKKTRKILAFASSSPQQSEKLESMKLTPKAKPVSGWMAKFVLPSRFSASVEAGLNSGDLKPNLKSEFVRDICTHLHNLTSTLNMKERVWVAQKIIEKYPCMADKVTTQSDNEWDTLQVKIFNRWKKLQKHNRLSSTSSGKADGQPKRKKSKIMWSNIPDVPEGESLESLKEYARSNCAKLVRYPKKMKLHKEFMEKTFPLRRHDILTSQILVKDVLKDYPSLKNIIHLKAEMCRIFEDSELTSKLRQKYATWQEKILKFAESSKNKDVISVIKSMEVAFSNEGCDSDEIKKRASLMVLNKHLRQRTGKKGVQDEVVSILERNADVDAALENFVQPQIVIVGEIYDADLLYVVAEGHIICKLSEHNIIDAVIGLLASFYVYNVEYAQSKAILTFLEQALLEIGRGQKFVTVINLFNELAVL